MVQRQRQTLQRERDRGSETGNQGGRPGSKGYVKDIWNGREDMLGGKEGGDIDILLSKER